MDPQWPLARCRSLGALAVLMSALAPSRGAAQETVSHIPLVPGLTLMSSLHLPEGDRENVVEVATVDSSGARYTWRLVEIRENGDTIAEQFGRLVRANDLAGAPRLERVSALEAGTGQSGGRTSRVGSRVVAPFVVVDPAGKAIFSVRADPRGFVLATPAGEDVAFGSALATGGFFKARSGSGSREAVLGVVQTYAAIELRDEAGQKRAVMALQDDNKPIVGLRKDNNVSVLALAIGASGGGYLQLGDASGNSTVEAGTTSEGVGLVRAYPLGNPGAGLVGMPGTFILGRR